MNHLAGIYNLSNMEEKSRINYLVALKPSCRRNEEQLHLSWEN